MTEIAICAELTEEAAILPACWQPPAREIVGVSFADDVRPWDWLELSEHEADKLWGYLDAFVAYFNARYGDRPAHRIPLCWPEHGPLVEEITTLAFSRWQAFSSVHASIAAAQSFHSYTLPGFYERLRHWLGTGLLDCQLGHHRAEEAIGSGNTGQQREHLNAVRGADLWLRCGGGDQSARLRFSLVPIVERQPL